MSFSFKRYRVRILLFLVPIIVSCIFITYHKDKKAYLTVAGPILMADGIGSQSADVIDALYDHVTISFLPTRKSENLDDVPLRIQPIINKRVKAKNAGTILLYEDSLPVSPRGAAKFEKKVGTKNANQIRIAYSMCEASRIPSWWTDILNNHFDVVVVPDSFLVEAYKLSGVSTPIFVLPLGLNIMPFLEHPIKKESHKPFCFINASSMMGRKNHLGLLEAFHRAFGNNPDVHLYMNYRYACGDALPKVEEFIASHNITNITLTNEKLNNQQYVDFLCRGDAFVTLAKGEGFSTQPRQAMALGLPVILSINTAHKTIMESNLVSGVPCPTSTPAYNPMFKMVCGEEYEADIDQAAAAMKELYNNYEKSLAKNEQRRLWAAQYQFQNLAPLYLSLIKPKKVVLGEQNQITEEMLITSSEALYNKYMKLTQKEKKSKG